MTALQGRNSLGLSFLASMLIHILILFAFAIFFASPSKNKLPEMNKMFVEIFERSFEKTPDRPLKLSAKTVQSQIIGPPIDISVEEEISIESPATDAANDMRDDAQSMKEQLLAAKKLSNEKALPHISDLIPSYASISKQISADKLIDGDLADDEVSLYTKNPKYVSYFSKLKHKIESGSKYPQAAIIAGTEGQGIIKFTVNRDGTLRDVSIRRSSGMAIIDDAAIKDVKRAAPFYPLPEHLGDKLTIVAKFIYAIDYNWR